MSRLVAIVFGLFALAAVAGPAGATAGVFNVRNHGATGDGATVDSPSIAATIDAAAAAGGGTVWVPAGRYLCFSIRLRSHITLQLDAGAVLVAGDPASGLGRYDAAEPNDAGSHQDFGHSHWQNSLLWGIALENIAIVGPGLIDGTKGLTRRGPPPRRPPPEQDLAPPPSGEPPGARDGPAARDAMTGLGNKAIALKLCRNVTLRDFSVLNGGHFALLATGVDHLTIDNLKVDTNRDGLDLDACRNVRIVNCSVNAPNDDAIVLKSSFALGRLRATENVTIADCFVSGFDVGTMLDGTFGRTLVRAPDRDGPTGRIKLGTESNGGFRNIVIANCVFERSRGLALETVDGGTIEDVAITNLVMREIANAPIFLRLGNRARGPAGTPVGAIRRVTITNVVASDVDARYPVILAGLPGHRIEDVTLDNVRIVSRGGLSLEVAAQQPPELVNPFFLRRAEPGATGPRDPFAVPERADGYPEPSMFGVLPACGLYARHVQSLTVRDMALSVAAADTRPAVVLDDVAEARFDGLAAPRTEGRPVFVLRDVTGFSSRHARGLPDTVHAAAERVAF